METTAFDRMNKLADIVVKKLMQPLKSGHGKKKYYFQQVESQKIDVKKEMVAIGYSPTYAETGRIFQKKGFKELLAEKITSEDIAAIQKGNLEAKSLQVVKVENKFTEEEAKRLAMALGGEFSMFSPESMWGKTAYFILPYYKIRDVSLDKFYKLAGEYAPEKVSLTARPFDGLTDAELAHKIKEAQQRFGKE